MGVQGLPGLLVETGEEPVEDGRRRELLIVVAPYLNDLGWASRRQPQHLPLLLGDRLDQPLQPRWVVVKLVVEGLIAHEMLHDLVCRQIAGKGQGQAIGTYAVNELPIGRVVFHDLRMFDEELDGIVVFGAFEGILRTDARTGSSS